MGAELLLCLLREDGAGELKWNLLHLDPGGSKLQQLPPGLRLLGWARQLSPEQMFEGCGFGFFLEIAPSAAAALPKLAALLLEQKHWMLEMLCQPDPPPGAASGVWEWQSCARPGTLCHGAGALPSPFLGGVVGGHTQLCPGPKQPLLAAQRQFRNSECVLKYVKKNPIGLGKIWRTCKCL